MGAVWVLNLDAEAELERPRGYRPSAATLERIARYEAVAARALLGPADEVFREGDVPALAWRGRPGRAFCPTPRALARLNEAGCVLPRAPKLEALRAANDRALSFRLARGLPGSFWIAPGREPVAVARDLERLAGSVIDRAGGGRWLLKRSFSSAGRGRRRVRPADLREDDRSWIAASLERGGLVVEPWVERIEVEFVLHAILSPSGDLDAVGQILVQVADAHARARRARRAQCALHDVLEPGRSASLAR